MSDTVREVYKRLDSSESHTHSSILSDQFNPHPGGDIALPYKERESVRITKQVISTILTVAFFLLLCRITHFRTKILYDKRIDRNFLRLFYFSVFMYFTLYFYLSLRLRYMRPENKRVPVELWDVYYPKVFYSCVAFLFLSILSFIFALIKTFMIMTFVIGFFGLMSVISIAQWIPI